MASGPVSALRRYGRDAASPACAVCPGALNLPSQVGATLPLPFGHGVWLPTLSLLAQDS